MSWPLFNHNFDKLAVDGLVPPLPPGVGDPPDGRVECLPYLCDNYSTWMDDFVGAWRWAPHRLGSDVASNFAAFESVYTGDGKDNTTPDLTNQFSNQISQTAQITRLLNNCPNVLHGYGDFSALIASPTTLALIGTKVSVGVLLDTATLNTSLGNHSRTIIRWPTTTGSIKIEIQFEANVVPAGAVPLERQLDVQVVVNGDLSGIQTHVFTDAYRFLRAPASNAEAPLFIGAEITVSNTGQATVEIFAGMGANTPLATEGSQGSVSFTGISAGDFTDGKPNQFSPMMPFMGFFQDTFLINGGMINADWDRTIVYAKTTRSDWTPPGDCPI